MALVRLKTRDNRDIQFEYSDPKQGGVKDVYFAPDRSYVVAFYRDRIDPVSWERLEKLVNQYRVRMFEVPGGDYWRNLFCWPDAIVEYEGKVGIVMPTYPKHFFFGANTTLSGEEKEGKWFASGKVFNRFVPAEEKGDLTSYLRICLKLSRAVRRLHNAGLAHSDLSYKNCLIDPKGGNACIIDIDGLVVPGLYPPDVLGTPDFIAPEVMKTLDLPLDNPKRCLPNQATDLHALAVLIYHYLFHRHPLRGDKVYSQDPQVQEKLEMGEKALFVENNSDHSNRINVKNYDPVYFPWIDTNKLPYTIMGNELKSLFEQAFITGLHDPKRRPTADNWEQALVKTCDLILPCANKSCINKWFVAENFSRVICPYCGQRFSGSFPVLDFYSTRVRNGSYIRDAQRLIVFDGLSLFRWHTNRQVFLNENLKPEDSKRVGYFIFHQGKWLFVNQSLTNLTELSSKKQIPVGSHVTITEGMQLLLEAGDTGRMARVQLVNA